IQCCKVRRILLRHGPYPARLCGIGERLAPFVRSTAEIAGKAINIAHLNGMRWDIQRHKSPQYWVNSKLSGKCRRIRPFESLTRWMRPITQVADEDLFRTQRVEQVAGIL